MHGKKAVLELDRFYRDIVNESVSARGHAVGAMRSCHGGAKTYGAAFVGREVYHNDMVRIACKIFASIGDAACRIGCLGDSLLEVQFTLVIGRAIVGCVDDKIAHRLETCGAGAYHAVVNDGFCRTVVATEEGVAGVLQIVCCPLLIVVAGVAIPDSTFIQKNYVFRDAAIDKASHVAVSYGKRVGKGIAGIAAVPQREGVFGCSGDCCCV